MLNSSTEIQYVWSLGWRWVIVNLGSRGYWFDCFFTIRTKILTNKYLKGIPENSRAAASTSYLGSDTITPEIIEKVQKLNAIAQERGPSLAQMVIVWILRNPEITIVLVGVSRSEQLLDNIAALDNLEFSSEELTKIEAILK